MCPRRAADVLQLFKDGLIYRGKRLVNWDTFLQTAVSDDEVFHETVTGHFWHFSYPVIDPQPGEPTHSSPSPRRGPKRCWATRPWPCIPIPAAALDKAEAELRAKAGRRAGERDKPAIQAATRRSRRAAARRCCRSLIKLRDMARAGRKLRLPLAGSRDSADRRRVGQARAGHRLREDHAGPRPERLRRRPAAQSADDQHPEPRRHAERQRRSLPRPENHAGPRAVVADLEKLGLLENVEDREIELAHSDRSKTPIEPYLADQWFVKMDAAGAIGDGRRDRRPREDHSRRATPSGYLDWLSEKRDWPIGRQLWWGHRIPVWTIVRRTTPRSTSTMLTWRTRNKGMIKRSPALDQMTRGMSDRR